MEAFRAASSSARLTDENKEEEDNKQQVCQNDTMAIELHLLYVVKFIICILYLIPHFNINEYAVRLL